MRGGMRRGDKFPPCLVKHDHKKMAAERGEI